jgi:hypothetical protein
LLEIECFPAITNNRTTLTSLQHGGKGDDILEEGYSYTGGPGADTFKCLSDGPLDSVVEDYNPEEGDTVSADCEIINQ